MKATKQRAVRVAKNALFCFYQQLLDQTTKQNKGGKTRQKKEKIEKT